MTRLFKGIVFIVAMSAPIFAHGEEVIVSAAASLKDALTELAPLCLKTTGVTLTPNLAASGILAQQIKAGAPADLFISADEPTMDSLDKAGLLQSNSRVDLLGNSLVFMVPADSNLTIDSAKSLALPAVRRIAVGDAKTVPAGEYAVEFLQNQKVLDSVKDKLVPLGNVRAVLSAVESGNAEVGVVYHSDALASTKSKIAWAVPAEIGPKIIYPLAVIKNSTSLAAAEKVRQFLMSDAARAVFVKWGFAPPPAAKTEPPKSPPPADAKPAATDAKPASSSAIAPAPKPASSAAGTGTAP